MRQEERHVLRKSDATRGDRKGRTDQQLPGIEKRERPPERPLAIEVFQVGVGAPRLRVGRPQFTPDQSVAERQERPHEPPQYRLWAAHHSDDQGQRDKRAYADHIDDVQAQRRGRRQPAPQLIRSSWPSPATTGFSSFEGAGSAEE